MMTGALGDPLSPPNLSEPSHHKVNRSHSLAGFLTSVTRLPLRTAPLVNDMTAGESRPSSPFLRVPGVIKCAVDSLEIWFLATCTLGRGREADVSLSLPLSPVPVFSTLFYMVPLHSSSSLLWVPEPTGNVSEPLAYTSSLNPHSHPSLNR